MYPRPNWVSEMSYRGLPYRHVDHQRGVCGTVHARVVAARNLRRLDWSYLEPLASRAQVNPYVMLRLGGSSDGVTTNVVRGTSDPTWAGEDFYLPVAKADVVPGRATCVDVQAFHSESVVGRVLPTMITGSNSLGLGQVELSPLLLGETQVLDVWVPLSTGAGAKGKGKGKGKGEVGGGEAEAAEGGAELGAAPAFDEHSAAVHLVIEYAAEGLAPQRGDVVYLEPFARSPCNQVLPPGDPLQVIETSGSFCLVRFLSASGLCECQLRVHRNALFVIERLTLVDGLWRTAMRPTDYVFSTRLGRFVKATAKPYLSYVNTLLAPVYFTANVGLGSVKLAIRSAAAGLQATGSAAINSEGRAVRRARRAS